MAWVSYLLPLYLGWRVYWANRLPIMDCDEVYNYWEPLHFILYDGGGGQQTWEYANQYALRTYAYIYPLKFLAWILRPTNNLSIHAHTWDWIQEQTTITTSVDNLLPDVKVYQFFTLRASLGLVMGLCEVVWLWSLWNHDKIHYHRALWTGVLLWSGAGMNHAAAAYLPSATWTAVWLLAHALFWEEWHYTFASLAVLATLSIGWPFGVILLIPMALMIMWKRMQSSLASLIRLMLWTALVTVVVQGVVLLIDFREYGRWTSATINILAYNAAAGGDQLYGVEPTSYYVKNLILNWNIVAPLGVAVFPLLLFSQVQRPDWQNLIVGTFLAMYLWLAIVVPRPHKEERFLFPIYPLLCFGAVWTVDTTINAIGRVVASLSRRKEIAGSTRMALHASVWIVAVLLSLSRTVALSRYYTAPLQIYAVLGPLTADSRATSNDTQQLLCTCGEWYRFPSSFFLPNNVHLAFLESSFKGQLPQRFSEFGSKPASLNVLQPFNDQNLEQKERYVNPQDCTWLVDLEGSECFAHYDYVQILAKAPFLNAEATVALHRILYIPFLHEKAMRKGHVTYHNYVLAQV